MDKIKKNEAGFSAVEMTLVIVIVALIGAVGWLVYKNHHKTTTAAITSTATSSTKPATSTKTTTSATQPTTSSNKPTTCTTSPASNKESDASYLTITQWGVRAPYTSSDTLSYVICDNDTNTAVIISKNMSDNFGCSGANDLPSGAGQIFRGLASAADDSENSPTPPKYAQDAQRDPTDFKQVGNYVYSFVRDEAACQANPTDAGGGSADSSRGFYKFSHI